MGVAPIFAAVLVQHAPDLIPQETLASLQGTITRTAQRNLLWLREWQRLLQAFEEAGITAISFKGPALALAAYGPYLVITCGPAVHARRITSVNCDLAV